MSQTAMDSETYLRERSFAAEVERDQTRFIDQSVLSLSGGALGISLAFVDKFIGASGAALPLFLAIAWGALVSSIVAVLVGMHVSQWAIDRHIRDLERYSIAPTGTAFPSNPWAKCTSVANAIASLLFIVGIICLLVFVYANYTSTPTARLS
jgi:hypothetical protein